MNGTVRAKAPPATIGGLAASAGTGLGAAASARRTAAVPSRHAGGTLSAPELHADGTSAMTAARTTVDPLCTRQRIVGGLRFRAGAFVSDGWAHAAGRR